jgi:hypothetical protein
MGFQVSGEPNLTSMWPANLDLAGLLDAELSSDTLFLKMMNFPGFGRIRKPLRRAPTNDSFSMFSSEIHDLSRGAVDVTASAEPISGNDSPDSVHVSTISVVTADKEASHLLPPNPFRLKPGEASSLDKASHSKLQYIMVPIEPLAIKRKCEACQQPHKPDAAPCFWSEDTCLYIARQSQCNSNICKGKKRWMGLEQKDFGWIRDSLEYLSVKPSTDGQLRPGIADHLLAGNDIPVDLQQPVGTKCNNCGTEGRTEARP